jgi:hypothetical protein
MPISTSRGLMVFSEGFSSNSTEAEDVFLSTYDDSVMKPKRTSEFIGNGVDGEERAAPHVLYIPERGEFVMWHAQYPEWELAISTSTDLKNWSRITGADPLYPDVWGHGDVVRVSDTIYLFNNIPDSNPVVKEFNVNDLTTEVNSTDLTVINDKTSRLRGRLTRCLDGWILTTTDSWGDVYAFETTFSDFPTGWTERSENPNPFGVEFSGDAWDAGGHRNPALCEVKGTPTLLLPGTVSSGGTADSQTGIYRLNERSERVVTVELPTDLDPETDVETTAGSFETLGDTYLPLDLKSAEAVWFSGEWKVGNDTSGEDTTFRINDTDSAVTLFSRTATGSGATTYKIVNEGPFDISNLNFRSNNLELQAAVTGGTGTLFGTTQGGLKMHALIGRDSY